MASSNASVFLCIGSQIHSTVRQMLIDPRGAHAMNERESAGFDTADSVYLRDDLRPRGF